MKNSKIPSASARAGTVSFMKHCHPAGRIFALGLIAAPFLGACAHLDPGNPAAAAENSAPIAFCHAIVPQSTSNDYETMEKREGRSDSLSGIDFDLHRTADQVAIEDLAAQVKIDPLNASDREQLEAKYLGQPSHAKIKIEQTLSLSPLWAHRDSRALAYVAVDKNGRMTDVYVANCTGKLIAQVVALHVKSCHFSGLDDEALVKIQYATKGVRVEEKIIN